MHFLIPPLNLREKGSPNDSSDKAKWRVNCTKIAYIGWSNYLGGNFGPKLVNHNSPRSRKCLLNIFWFEANKAFIFHSSSLRSPRRAPSADPDARSGGGPQPAGRCQRTSRCRQLFSARILTDEWRWGMFQIYHSRHSIKSSMLWNRLHSKASLLEAIEIEFYPNCL